MKKAKFLLKFFLFFILFFCLLLIVQEHLRDKWAEGEYNPSVKIDGFYAEEKDTLDVVFIGSSQMYAHMAPAVLFENYGITSYDFCANEQPLWVSYYYIREAIRQQHPKVIVLDVFTVYGDDYEEEGVMHINLDDLKMNRNKIGAIQNGVPEKLRYSYYFPIAKYHNTWPDFYQGKMDYSFYREKDPNKGYSPFIFAGDYEDSAKKEVVNQKEIQELPERAAQWLNRIIQLCRDENTPLVLIKTPNGNAERQKLYNAVSVIAKENQIPFFNMNVLLDGQAHINVLQAEKVSLAMGEYLTEHFEFTDKRQDDMYLSWNETVHLFQRQKARCQLVSAGDFASYLPLLADEDYLVILQGKNDGTNSYKEEDIAYLNQTLSLHCDLQENPQKPYYAILDGGRVVAESNLQNRQEKMEYEVQNEMQTLKIKLASDSILVNGTDFSLNCDGFNLAVYDKYLCEMIEMSAFDIHNDMALLRK